jgi:predicted ATPase/DNA-binding winged helix-turn-helix (wHTH) protein
MQWTASHGDRLTAKGSISFGPFRLFVSERRLEKDGNTVHLSPRALDILITLVEGAGRVVSKSDLMARAWPDVEADESNLRVQVATLRKVLGDREAGARYVTTISGQGYCFVARVSHTSDPQVSDTRPKSAQQNLPQRPIPMVGRDQTVREISEKLTSERFVTIVGPGGIGKTTVAVSTGHNLLVDFVGAVYFVDLGTVQDSALVPNVVASTLGLFGQSNNPSTGLVAFLRDKRMLLILDCCEHVIETTAALAERLYMDAPQVHILATSRESLRVEGEHILRLMPLACPPDHACLTAAQALTFPAVQLFVQRAIAGSGRFELNDNDARFIGELCRRLDGIALAIELAASRACIYGVKQTIALLNDQFKLLWEGRRTALPRHYTLRATLDWSYNLLTASERVILCRLSIFVGTFTLEGARAVATANETDESRLSTVLGSLVTKSIVNIATSNGSICYRLLDTTRTYALEKLAAHLDADTTARQHALYILNMLERIASGNSPEFSSFASRAAQFGNVRAALTWCFSERGDRTTGVALAAASMPLFFELSQLRECQLWAMRAIESLDYVDRDIRHDLSLHAALGLVETLVRGNTEEAGSCLTRALRLAEEIGELPDQLRLIEQLHLYHFRRWNFTEALELAKKGEAIASKNGDQVRLARIQLALGISHHIAGNSAVARSYLEAAILHLPGSEPAVADQLYFDHVNRAQITLARILWLQGFSDQAGNLARRAITDALDFNHPVRFSMAVIWGFSIFYWNSELEWLEEYVDRLLVETDKHAMGPYQTIGQAAKGTILIQRGQVEAGIAMLRRSKQQTRNHRYGLPTDYTISLASTLAARGQEEEALDTINQAIVLAENSGNLLSLPELLRVKAEILMSAKKPDSASAEHLLRQALDRARRQSSLAWELRIATSLAKLWAPQDRHHEAHKMLAPAFARFDEGFDRHDLRVAKEMLDKLNSAL